MKIQVDTDNKVIRLDEKTNLGNFIEIIQKMLPDDWQDYVIDTNTIIEWTNPIQVYPYTQPYYPHLWQPSQPIITYGDDNTVPNHNIKFSTSTGDDINPIDPQYTNTSGSISYFHSTSSNSAVSVNRLKSGTGTYNLEIL